MDSQNLIVKHKPYREAIPPLYRAWICEELSRNEHATELDRYSSVARAAALSVQHWLGDEPGAPADKRIAGVAYCATLHSLSSPDFTLYEQVFLGNNLQIHFFDRRGE
jgi:hypothetical protein